MERVWEGQVSDFAGIPVIECCWIPKGTAYIVDEGGPMQKFYVGTLIVPQPPEPWHKRFWQKCLDIFEHLCNTIGVGKAPTDRQERR